MNRLGSSLASTTAAQRKLQVWRKFPHSRAHIFLAVATQAETRKFKIILIIMNNQNMQKGSIFIYY